MTSRNPADLTGDPDHQLPAYADFGDHRLPIEVIVVWRIGGGWHLSTLLYRTEADRVSIHPLSTEPFFDASGTGPEAEWGYLAERLHEGRGGNGYTYEVNGFEVAEVAHISPIVMAWAAEVVAATHGPMGETAGTMIAEHPGSVPTAVVPFVALTDDSGDRFLVATGQLATSTPCDVRTEVGRLVDPVTFESLVNWQRSGSRSWPVSPGTPYLVTWSDQTVRFVVDDDGGWADLQLLRAAGSCVEDQGPQGEPSLTVEERMEDAVPRPSTFHIQRVQAPWNTAEPCVNMADLTQATGEQYEWGYAIPWTFRALASPHTNEPMPAAPQRGDDVYAATGYWASLLHLLCYSFGWARPDHGLHWWFEAGKPVDDPRLQLLMEIWDRDGQLDWFAAQLSGSALTFPIPLLAEVIGHGDMTVSAAFDRRWIEVQRRSADASGIPSPISDGGGDPLHLSMHCSAPLEVPAGEALLLRTDLERRRAILKLDSMVGWYRALSRHGANLPELHGRSWHVDVVVRPVGWLGTYRRSRLSGLWFAGRHRYHTPGI